VLKKGLHALHTDPFNQNSKIPPNLIVPIRLPIWRFLVSAVRRSIRAVESTEKKLLFYKSSGSGLCTVANLHHVHARFKIGHINLHLVISASNNIR